jgi:outer membrane receptor for ferrienterochelin and colicins
MQRRLISCSLFVVLFLLAGPFVRGQQVVVKITDVKSHEPVAFANVCIEALKSGEQKHFISDLKGNVPNMVNEPSKIAVSLIGYETMFDTIFPGKNTTIYIKPTALNIDEVVITAQFAPEKADKSIYKVNVINSRQIDQKGATNLSDILKTQLNMRVEQNGVLGSSLSLHGLSGENVKFLMDGVPMIGRMNGNIDLGQINLANVDHIELVEGPMSVIYGSNALAGVVNIISKENKIARLSTHADTYFESIGTINFNAGISSNIKKHVISLEAGRNFFPGYSDNKSSRSKTWIPRRQYTADAYYIWSDQKMKIKVSGQYFNDYLVDKGNLITPYLETAFDSYFTTRRYSGTFNFDQKLPHENNVNAILSYSGYDRIKKTYFNNLTTLQKILSGNPEDNDTTTIQAITARMAFNNATPDIPLTYQFGIDMNVENGSGKRITGHRQQIGDYAGYFIFKYNPTPLLSFQPGVRAIYNTKYSAPLIYSLSAKWDAVEHISFRSSASRGFRSPAIKELYLYFVDINHNVQGNSKLGAETSYNFDFNAGFNSGGNTRNYSVEAGVYYNNISNMITLAQQGTSLYTYINVDKYKTKGGQINATYSIYPQFTIKAGLSETGRYYMLNASENRISKFAYTTDLTSDLSYKIVKSDVIFSVFYKFTGRTPQFYVDKSEQVVEGFISNYHTMDVTSMKSFLHNRLNLSVGINNIFNNKTIEAVAGAAGGSAHGGGSGSMNIGLGRTYFAKLSFVFNSYR